MKHIARITLGMVLMACTILIQSCNKEDIRKNRKKDLENRNYCYYTGCWQEETAWSKGCSYSTSGWAMYTQYNANTCVDLIAGQNEVMGTVCFSDVVNGKVTITIDFLPGWDFQVDPETVKVQGYNSAPSGKVAPGKFKTHKGGSAVIEVDPYAYYGIHIDVRKQVECE